MISCYYEEDTIDEFHRRLSATLESIGRPYEIIIIDDGSSDRTFERIEAIFHRDENVAVAMDLLQNAGQLRAWTAGICESRGEVVLLIDSDLQLAPEELPLLLEEWDKGCDVVSGYLKNRQDSLFRILPSKIANMIMRRVSGTDLRDFGCTYKLYSMKLLRAFELGPFNPFQTAAILSRAGHWSEVPISHVPRKVGESGWTFKKLWEFNMDNIALLLQRPFQIMAGVGALVAVLMVVRLLIELFTPISLLGDITHGLLLNSIVISWVLLLAALAIIGEFGIRSFRASLRIPSYVVRRTLRR